MLLFYHLYFSRQHPFTTYGRRMAHKIVDQFELLYTENILDVVTLHHPNHFEVIQKNNGHCANFAAGFLVPRQGCCRCRNAQLYRSTYLY